METVGDAEPFRRLVVEVEIGSCGLLFFRGS